MYVPKMHYEHTCCCADVDCLRSDAAIHFDILVGESFAEVCDFGNTAIEELLSAASCGVDGLVLLSMNITVHIGDKPG